MKVLNKESDYIDWKELKQKRCSSPDLELKRLNQDERIACSIQTSISLSSDQHKIGYGHSLEILQFANKNGYYAFNHGQNLDLMVINIFAKELLKKMQPEKKLSQFHFLRHPAFLKESKKHSVDEIKKKLEFEVDHDYKDELICVDGYFENKNTCESALSFFTAQKNIASGFGFLEKICKEIAKFHAEDASEFQIEKTCKRLGKIASEISKGGNLYTILVPKDKFSTVGYRAHAFGHPCTHKVEGMTEEQILEDLQMPVSSSCPHDCGTYQNPQYRLLTHQLTKENGVLVFLNSTMEKAAKNQVKEKIREVVKDLFLPLNLSDKVCEKVQMVEQSIHRSIDKKVKKSKHALKAHLLAKEAISKTTKSLMGLSAR